MTTVTGKKRVLISGAGGAGTIEVIKQLRKQGHFVLAIDMDPYAAGLYLAQVGLAVPGVLTPSYFKHMSALIRKHRIHVYIPLIDEELIGAKTLEGLHPGLRVITPAENFIRFVLDKYGMTKRFMEDGIICPLTWKAGVMKDGADLSQKIIKPITGRGSRGVMRIDSKADWKAYFTSQPYTLDQVMVQEYIQGTEYTVSAVVGKTGRVHAVVPKKIIVKRGITTRSVTVKHPGIERLVHQIQERYCANGPFNVQLMEKNRKLYVLEVNPRFSTTVAHTMAAGVDEVGCLMDDFCDDKFPKKPLVFKEGLVMIRYMTQMYVPKDKLL